MIWRWRVVARQRLPNTFSSTVSSTGSAECNRGAVSPSQRSAPLIAYQPKSECKKKEKPMCGGGFKRDCFQVLSSSQFGPIVRYHGPIHKWFEIHPLCSSAADLLLPRHFKVDPCTNRNALKPTQPLPLPSQEAPGPQIGITPSSC